MVKLKNVIISAILLIFFSVTIIHSCSDKGRLATYKLQAGERLIYFFEKEGLSKDILKVDGFKYYEINILLLGDESEYERFITKIGYKNKTGTFFCKDGNSIRLLKRNENILLKYIYDDKYCI
ncbi:hypothetical protein BKK51_04635 [Rodentibacter trehalosifermentans]|uniref:Uncharacterized protein n=1 Tax=Rodentibacter trehalosifermentans TaxID=1908263 RepID=A0A1V3IUC9_9PAST|nr:hypothetical protein [Rodentibacter trehalosifermentans]OOF45773.1 hypothetical protein BKK52_12075 [Rodentibacter trehalosifermentans]OOF45951.1 hypothetical protein BKK51_04635 [Rodentibacter trehalosifermentans]